MTENLEAYLASDQAVADVAALLADAPRNINMFLWRQPACAPSWCMVAIPLPHRNDGACLNVYFRLDEAYRCSEITCVGSFCNSFGHRPRYIVTDCGEAMRARRLLTGCSATSASEAARVVKEAASVTSWGNGLWIETYEGSLAIESKDRSGVPTADLPRAICALMLAAYRVIRLTCQGCGSAVCCCKPDPTEQRFRSVEVD